MKIENPNCTPKSSFVRLLFPILSVSVFVSGCSEASEAPVKMASSYVPMAGWSTVCIDRILIDLPAMVEMGATEPEFDGAYGFQGVRDIGGGGIEWGKTKIFESHPTDRRGLKKVSVKASALVASPERYQALLRAKKEDIEYDTKQTLRGTAEEIAAAKSRLAKSNKELEDSYYGLKVSGQAKLSEDHAFAVRRGDLYSVGYIDAADKRVRKFDGAITRLDVQSPDAAALELREIQQLYRPRLPTEIPTGSGYCTAHGFINEASKSMLDSQLSLPFRSLKYPNLFFTLTVMPAFAGKQENIQKLPNMDADRAILHEIGIKRDYGPIATTILDAPARSYGHEYGPNCSKESCRPADQAYEFESQTFGEPGNPKKPRVTLHMIAATSDDYKLKNRPFPGDPSYNTPDRPALSGRVPPSYEEGKRIFEQVLHSIRLRPGAIGEVTVGIGAPSVRQGGKN